MLTVSNSRGCMRGKGVLAPASVGTELSTCADALRVRQVDSVGDTDKSLKDDLTGRVLTVEPILTFISLHYRHSLRLQGVTHKHIVCKQHKMVQVTNTYSDWGHQMPTRTDVSIHLGV